MLHRTALRAATTRRELALKMESVRSPKKATKHQGERTASTRNTRNNAVSAVVLLLFIASLWGPAAWSASREVGMSAARRAEVGFYHSGCMTINESAIGGDCLTFGMDNPNLARGVHRLMERHYGEAVGPGSCLYDMANPRSTGKTDDVTRVPSSLKSTKDGSAHGWIIGTGFKLKK
jgi:hypothetical protein